MLPARIDRADPHVEGMLMADLNMLAVTGGRGRSEPEWTSLSSSAGFQLRRVVPVPRVAARILEAVPCG